MCDLRFRHSDFGDDDRDFQLFPVSRDEQSEQYLAVGLIILCNDHNEHECQRYIEAGIAVGLILPLVSLFHATL